METIRLDAGRLCGREEAMELLGQALGLPEWWGRNLDALHDCLTEPGCSVRLELWNLTALEDGKRPFGRRLLGVLADCAAENPGIELVLEQENVAR